jgi:uncharacterized protein
LLKHVVCFLAFLIAITTNAAAQDPREFLRQDYQLQQRLRSQLPQLQSVPQVSNTSPSFECAKAKQPDELTICSSNELSQLDGLVASGYAFVRRRYGDQKAKEVGAPLLSARRSCGSDVGCIRSQQFLAIQAYKDLGAPLIVPQYGTGGAIQPNAPPPTVSSSKPTFDCAKAQKPIALIICSGEDGAKADWALSTASWAYAFTMDEQGRSTFSEAEDDWIKSLNQLCHLTSGTSATERGCVIGNFNSRATALQSKLTGDALAETKLTPEQRAFIQNKLISFGFLSDLADGEFGANTRNAINQFHQRNGLAGGNFLTEEDREFLLTGFQRSSGEAVVSAGPPPSVQSGPRAQSDPSTPQLQTTDLPNATQGSSVEPTHGWIGVKVQDVTGSAVRTLGLNDAVNTGARVIEAVVGGPAAKAGILSGDAITAVNGNPAKDARDLARKIGSLSPLSKATLTVIRAGDVKTIVVAVGADFAADGGFSDIEKLIAIPNACTMARQIGPKQMYVQDPFTGRNSPGPFCEAATECLVTLTQRVPELVNYLRQHPQLMKQLDLPREVYTVLGQAERSTPFPLNVNCTYANMAMNNNLFSLNPSINSQGAFERLFFATQNLLSTMRSDYNAGQNNYTTWLPFAKHYDYSDELAEIEVKYQAAYVASDVENFLQLNPEFDARLSAAEEFKGKLIQQVDQLELLESQFIDLSRKIQDEKIATKLAPEVAKAVDTLKAKIHQLHGIAPAERGDVSDEIDDIMHRKMEIEKQIELAQKTDEARRHGFSSAEDYENCLTEQQKLQASGIQKSCDR